MLPTNSLKAEIYGQTSDARRAYRPMSDAVKTKTSPLSSLKGSANIVKNSKLERKIENFAKKFTISLAGL